MRKRYHITTCSCSTNPSEKLWCVWDADLVRVVNNGLNVVSFKNAEDAYSFCCYLNCKEEDGNPEQEHHDKIRNATDYYYPENE